MNNCPAVAAATATAPIELENSEDDCIIVEEEASCVDRDESGKIDNPSENSKLRAGGKPIHPFFARKKVKLEHEGVATNSKFPETTETPVNPPLQDIIDIDKSIVFVGDDDDDDDVSIEMPASALKKVHPFLLHRRPKIVGKSLAENVKGVDCEVASSKSRMDKISLVDFPSLSHVGVKDFLELLPEIEPFPLPLKIQNNGNMKVGEFQYKMVQVPWVPEGPSFNSKAISLEAVEHHKASCKNYRAAREGLERWLKVWRSSGCHVEKKKSRKHHRKEDDKIKYVRVIGDQVSHEYRGERRYTSAYVDDLDDFIVRDDLEEEEEQSYLPVIIITGPCGTGKSALVSEVAKLLDFEIVEIKQVIFLIGSSSSARSKSILMSFFGETVQNKHVKASFFGNRDLVAQHNDSASIYLMEEVDVLFTPQDSDFWSGISQLMRASKHPIIMTSNESIENLMRIPGCPLTPWDFSHIALSPMSLFELSKEFRDYSSSFRAVSSRVLELGADSRKLFNNFEFLSMISGKACGCLDLKNLSIASVTRLLDYDNDDIFVRHGFSNELGKDSCLFESCELDSWLDSHVTLNGFKDQFDDGIIHEANTSMQYGHCRNISERVACKEWVHLDQYKKIHDSLRFLAKDVKSRLHFMNYKESQSEAEAFKDLIIKYHYEDYRDSFINEASNERRVQLFNNLFHLDKIFDSRYLIDFYSLVDQRNLYDLQRRNERRRHCNRRDKEILDHQEESGKEDVFVKAMNSFVFSGDIITLANRQNNKLYTF